MKKSLIGKIERNLSDHNMSQPYSEVLKTGNKKKYYAVIFKKIKEAGSLENLAVWRGWRGKT